VLALLVYGQILGHGFVRWDDGLLILDQPIVHSLTPWSVWKAFTTYDPELYIPATFVTYQLGWLVGGGAAWPFHAASLLLHLGSAWLLALLAHSLSRRWWAGLLAGLVFLLHPLNTEGVAWASGMKDVLSTFFWLLSALWYVQWRDGDDRKYWRSVAAFAVGLLAKATVIGLPIALLLLDWARGRKLDRQALLEKLPYFGLSLVFGIVAVFGKAEITRSSTLMEKVAMAGKSIAFYVQQLVWPHSLSALYPYRDAVSLTSPDFYLPWIAVLAVTAACLLALWKTRLPLFAWLVFLLGVGPTLINFAKGGEIYFASDRYAYLGMVGLLVALAAGLARLLPDGPEDDALPPGRARFTLTAAGLALVAGLGVLSFRQAQVWRDTRSLFTQVIDAYPAAADVAYTNIGVELSLAGDNAAAIPEFNSALAIRETAKPWGALGDIARRERRFADAHGFFAKALALEPKNPEAHLGLALLLHDEGRYGESEAEFKAGLGIDTDSVPGWVNYGSLLIKQNRPQEAAAALEKAVAIDPGQDEAWYNLGVAYGAIGDLEGARDAYKAALKLDPADVPGHLNLASVQHALGDTKAAIRELQIVLRLDPTNAAAANALHQLQ
jgi:tetratricopeptide (TPR) repeat protein